MTLFQIAEQIQRFVKDGVIRGRDTLDEDDYFNLAVIARDYVLFELKKGSEMLYMDMQVTNTEHILKISANRVELPKGYNPQGISGAEMLDSSECALDDLIMPIAKGGNPLISHSPFTYYLIGQNEIELKNKPKEAKYLRVYNICGTDPNDEVNNSIAFLIFQQIIKIGMASEQMPKDTSADGNPWNDMVKEQVRQLINNPNGINA